MMCIDLRNLYHFLINAILVLIPGLLVSQNQGDIVPECATDFFHRKAVRQMLKEGRDIYSSEDKIRRELQHGSHSANRELFTLPIVFHVVHTGSPVGQDENISDEQIIDGLAHANAMFRGTGGFSGPDVEFDFSLAKRSPGCEESSGINRIDFSDNPAYVSDGVQVNNGAGVDELVVKSASVWPNDQYINVWIINKIEGRDGTSGRFIAGYSYLPEFSPDPVLDGIVILASQMKADNETLGHELGHYFNLYHTFEGDGDGSVCPIDNDCTLDGDRVCDTDPIQRSSFSCRVDEDNPCTGRPFGLSVTNHMDYSSCSERFTEGQRSRMRTSLLQLRSGLISSQGDAPPPDTLPTAACIPTINPANDGNDFGIGPTRVVFNNLDYISGTQTTDGVYIDLVCQQVVEVDLGQSYEIQVVTEVNEQKVRVFVDYNNDGDFSDNGEIIFSSDENGVPQIHRGIVAIPEDVPITDSPIRMRVLADFIAGTEDPCGPLEFGQVEDYSIIINSNTTSTPIIQNPTVSFITATTAKCGAEIVSDGGSEILERGVVWSVNPQPILGENQVNQVQDSLTAIGIYNLDVMGLASNSRIFFRGYAKNAVGTSYTNDLSFITPEVSEIPVLSSLAISGITDISAIATARLEEEGTSEVTQQGFIYSTSPNPTIDTPGIIIVEAGNGELGAYSTTLSDLSPNTTLFVRGFGTNESGTGYTDPVSFTTLEPRDLPVVEDPTIRDITETSVILGANVTAEGSSSITERGIFYSTLAGETLLSPGIISTSASNPGLGRFSIEFTDLEPGTSYCFRGYAINATDTVYTADSCFTTLGGSNIPVLVLDSIVNISAFSANSFATINSEGGSSLVEAGFVFDTSPNPSLNNAQAVPVSITDIIGGRFSSLLNELTINTTYYIRAYARNADGLGYSNELSFTTTADSTTKIISFNGIVEENGVRLNWTAIEVNNNKFIIERSLDSLNFESVREISGVGTSIEATTYSELTNPESSGDIFFRIRYIDIEGNEGFSEIIRITFESQKNFIVFPNPVQEEVQVEIPLIFSDDAHIIVVDATGRVLKREDLASNIGQSVNLTINTYNWPNGIYFATLFNGDEITFEQIIKY